MSDMRSPTLRLRAQGPLACFTRPELKAERVSYPVITPSAARGLLEAISWKPAIAWHVQRIHVLAPVRFTSFRRNEVNSKTPKPPRTVVRDGGKIKCYFAENDRAQRNTVALRDVDYVIEAHIRLTDRAGEGDNMTKFVSMFERRLAKGQHYHQPYFGCREFVAQVTPVEEIPKTIPDSGDLGVMLWDIDYGQKRNRPRFFRAYLHNGVLEIPADPEATLAPATQREGDKPYDTSGTLPAR